MRHVRLISFCDEITGELGLGVKGHTSHPLIFADRTGLLIAHDIVEHQNGMDAIGSWHDELEAMGGCWHIRGRNGVDIGNNYYSPEQSVAHDFVSIAVDLDRDEDLGIYPRLHRYNTRPHDYDEDFMAIIEIAKPLIASELSDNEHPFPLEAFLDNALHLMRRGYRKSARRWGGDGDLGVYTFQAITKAIKPHAAHLEMEGQEFRLSYGSGEARCEEAYDAEW